MAKIRKLFSIENGLEEAIKILNEEEIKQAIGKSSSYVRKCSDPQEDSDGVKRNISHTDSVLLDKACLKKGKLPPMFEAHKMMLSSEDFKGDKNIFDVDDLLIKLTILHGDLNKIIKEAQDPKGHDGQKISKVEKKKIFETIKKLENKILKIKHAVDKN